MAPLITGFHTRPGGRSPCTVRGGLKDCNFARGRALAPPEEIPLIEGDSHVALATLGNLAAALRADDAQVAARADRERDALAALRVAIETVVGANASASKLIRSPEAALIGEECLSDARILETGAQWRAACLGWNLSRSMALETGVT